MTLDENDVQRVADDIIRDHEWDRRWHDEGLYRVVNDEGYASGVMSKEDAEWDARSWPHPKDQPYRAEPYPRPDWRETTRALVALLTSAPEPEPAVDWPSSAADMLALHRGETTSAEFTAKYLPEWMHPAPDAGTEPAGEVVPLTSEEVRRAWETGIITPNVQKMFGWLDHTAPEPEPTAERTWTMTPVRVVYTGTWDDGIAPAGGTDTEHCHADRDGDCVDSRCPQLRDGEPKATGRHCPLDKRTDDEEGL